MRSLCLTALFAGTSVFALPALAQTGGPACGAQSGSPCCAKTGQAETVPGKEAAMPGPGRATKPGGCGCAATAEPPSTAGQAPSARPIPDGNLPNLIPIAVVIVGGCDTCAETMVTRALEQGSSVEDIETSLRIVAGMREAECIAKAFGPEAIARMEKPLAAGRRILRDAAARAGQ